MFRIAYQPIWDIVNNTIIGYEALMRPDNGSSPVDVLEEHRKAGCITGLDQQLMFRAMTEFKEVLEPGQLLMVNTEPETLREADWKGPWTFPLSAEQVCFEITERATLDDLELANIQNIGIQFAIDDFGTGMSNLLALEKLKPTYVKMGRSFLETHNDHGVLALFADQLARFGTKLIVEGVETREDLTFLRHIRARYVQGFLTGKPIFAEDHQRAKEQLGYVSSRS